MQDYIDANHTSREEWINRSVLADADILLEPNMFPYNTPRGIEHWTLWSRRDLQLHEVEEYMQQWIKTERPQVVRWNLDENAERSINIYHVHVYIQVVPDDEVRPPIEEDEWEDDRGRDGEGDAAAQDRDDGDKAREDKEQDEEEGAAKRARLH